MNIFFKEEDYIYYKKFLQEEKTRTGKPCGDKEFYDKIQEVPGFDYKNKKKGQRKKLYR